MTEDDFADLMAEPAGGNNHGWHRNAQGGWTSLQLTDLDPPREAPFVARDCHGREFGYRQMKCRCILCRAWKAASNKSAYESIKGPSSMREPFGS